MLSSIFKQLHRIRLTESANDNAINKDALLKELSNQYNTFEHNFDFGTMEDDYVNALKSRVGNHLNDVQKRFNSALPPNVQFPLETKLLFVIAAFSKLNNKPISEPAVQNAISLYIDNGILDNVVKYEPGDYKSINKLLMNIWNYNTNTINQSRYDNQPKTSDPTLKSRSSDDNILSKLHNICAHILFDSVKNITTDHKNEMNIESHIKKIIDGDSDISLIEQNTDSYKGIKSSCINNLKKFIDSGVDSKYYTGSVSNDIYKIANSSGLSNLRQYIAHILMINLFNDNSSIQSSNISEVKTKVNSLFNEISNSEQIINKSTSDSSTNDSINQLVNLLDNIFGTDASKYNNNYIWHVDDKASYKKDMINANFDNFKRIINNYTSSKLTTRQNDDFSKSQDKELEDFIKSQINALYNIIVQHTGYISISELELITLLNRIVSYDVCYKGVKLIKENELFDIINNMEYTNGVYNIDKINGNAKTIARYLTYIEEDKNAKSKDINEIYDKCINLIYDSENIDDNTKDKYNEKFDKLFPNISAMYQKSIVEYMDESKKINESYVKGLTILDNLCDTYDHNQIKSLIKSFNDLYSAVAVPTMYYSLANDLFKKLCPKLYFNNIIKNESDTSNVNKEYFMYLKNYMTLDMDAAQNDSKLTNVLNGINALYQNINGFNFKNSISAIIDNNLVNDYYNDIRSTPLHNIIEKAEVNSSSKVFYINANSKVRSNMSGGKPKYDGNNYSISMINEYTSDLNDIDEKYKQYIAVNDSGSDSSKLKDTLVKQWDELLTKYNSIYNKSISNMVFINDLKKVGIDINILEQLSNKTLDDIKNINNAYNDNYEHIVNMIGDDIQNCDIIKLATIYGSIANQMPHDDVNYIKQLLNTNDNYMVILDKMFDMNLESNEPVMSILSNMMLITNNIISSSNESSKQLNDYVLETSDSNSANNLYNSIDKYISYDFYNIVNGVLGDNDENGKANINANSVSNFVDDLLSASVYLSDDQMDSIISKLADGRVKSKNIEGQALPALIFMYLIKKGYNSADSLAKYVASSYGREMLTKRLMDMDDNTIDKVLSSCSNIKYNDKYTFEPSDAYNSLSDEQKKYAKFINELFDNPAFNINIFNNSKHVTTSVGGNAYLSMNKSNFLNKTE